MARSFQFCSERIPITPESKHGKVFVSNLSYSFALLNKCNASNFKIGFRSTTKSTQHFRLRHFKPTCATGSGNRGGSEIMVVINGVSTELGKEAVKALKNARGMKLAGAVDSNPVHNGKDVAELAGLNDPLEIPVVNDIIMVLASISQTKANSVFVDFGKKELTYENIRQATAFGFKSIVCSGISDEEEINKLITFCDKASTGCIIAPNLNIGFVLLQRAAISASFYYNHCSITESVNNPEEDSIPSLSSIQLADSISGLGQNYNSNQNQNQSQDQNRDRNQNNSNYLKSSVLGDGIRVDTFSNADIFSSIQINFSNQGQTLYFGQELNDAKSFMPGLLLAIRKVVRMKSLVYGLEKIL